MQPYTVTATASKFIPKLKLAVTDSYAHCCHLHCRYLVQPYTDQPVAAPASTSRTGNAQHYEKTPQLVLTAEPASNRSSVSALWTDARFPGHFDYGEALCSGSCGCSVLRAHGRVAWRGVQCRVLYATFGATRLVSASTACVVKVEQAELPDKAPAAVKSVHGVTCYHCSLPRWTVSRQTLL